MGTVRLDLGLVPRASAVGDLDTALTAQVRAGCRAWSTAARTSSARAPPAPEDAARLMSSIALRRLSRSSSLTRSTNRAS